MHYYVGDVSQQTNVHVLSHVLFNILFTLLLVMSEHRLLHYSTLQRFMSLPLLSLPFAFLSVEGKSVS